MVRDGLAKEIISELRLHEEKQQIMSNAKVGETTVPRPYRRSELCF